MQLIELFIWINWLNCHQPHSGSWLVCNTEAVSTSEEALQCFSPAGTLNCVSLWSSFTTNTALNMSRHCVNVLTWPHSQLACDSHRMRRRLTSDPPPNYTACCSLVSILSRGCAGWKWDTWKEISWRCGLKQKTRVDFNDMKWPSERATRKGVMRPIIVPPAHPFSAPQGVVLWRAAVTAAV